MITHVDVCDGKVKVDGVRYVRAVLCIDCKYMGRYKKKYLCCRHRKCLVPVSWGDGCSYGVNEKDGEQE